MTCRGDPASHLVRKHFILSFQFLDYELPQSRQCINWYIAAYKIKMIEIERIIVHQVCVVGVLGGVRSKKVFLFTEA